MGILAEDLKLGDVVRIETHPDSREFGFSSMMVTRITKDEIHLSRPYIRAIYDQDDIIESHSRGSYMTVYTAVENVVVNMDSSLPFVRVG